MLTSPTYWLVCAAIAAPIAVAHSIWVAKQRRQR